MVIKLLSELGEGEKGRIMNVGGRGRIRRRLLDMGIVSGAMVEVRRIAPLGDPVLIRLKGYDLAVRKEEARNIGVEMTVMPLSMASSGQRVQVEAVRAGWGLQRRLNGLGIVPGVRIDVIDSGRPGQVIVDINGSRVGLGRGMAHKIMVVASNGADK